MQLSRDELLLILAAFDFKEFTELSQRLETFLAANRDEETFTIIGKSRQGQLAFTGFVASGALELEQRIEALEEQNKRNAAHIARLTLLIDMLHSAKKREQ